MKNLINLNLTGAIALLVCLFANSAVADHDGTTPNATITAEFVAVDPGEDVIFNAKVSGNLNHTVLVRVNWAGHDRYWWVGSGYNDEGFEFSFPCNLATKGSHTIAIPDSDTTTDEATQNSHESQGGSIINPAPTAYNVGSLGSATSTCN